MFNLICSLRFDCRGLTAQSLICPIESIIILGTKLFLAETVTHLSPFYFKKGSLAGLAGTF